MLNSAGPAACRRTAAHSTTGKSTTRSMASAPTTRASTVLAAARCSYRHGDCEKREIGLEKAMTLEVVSTHHHHRDYAYTHRTSEQSGGAHLDALGPHLRRRAKASPRRGEGGHR